MPKLSALGVFIYAGGFTLGVSDFFNVEAVFEDGEFGVDTHHKNFPHVPVHKNPVSWPIERYAGVDLLYANPPCSVFSPLGRSMTHGKDNWITDPNCRFMLRVMKLLEEVRPRIHVIESVPQFATRGAELLDRYTKEAMALGYGVTHLFVDPKFMGLPQQRRRIFVVASQVEVDWQPPVFNGMTTVRQALRGVEPDHLWWLPEQFMAVGSELEEGHHLRGLWDRVYPDAPKPRPRFVDHRIAWDHACGTIFGYIPPPQIHPQDPRYLSPRELAALCGFPRDYIWPEHGGQAVLEVAKGVTPTAARFLAGQLAGALERNEPTKGEAWVVDFRAPSTRIADFRQSDRRRQVYESVQG